MFEDPKLIILMVVVAAVAVFGVLAFTRTFGKSFLRKLPFVRSAPRHFFVRWLTTEQVEILRQAGISCAPHTVRNEQGVRFDGKDLKKVLAALRAHVVAAFDSGQTNTEEVVLSFRPAQLDPALQALPVIVSGRFDYSKFLWWR